MSKSKNSKTKTNKRARFSPEMDAYLRGIAKDLVSKPAEERRAIESHPDLKRLIGHIVEVALEEEMNEHLGYAPGERMSPEEIASTGSSRRANTRNGFASKTLRTSQGDMPVKVPRDRQGEFEPQILPKRSSITQDVEQRIIALYTQGMSTRQIEEFVTDLYGTNVSHMFVSRLVSRLDSELVAWRNRPLEPLVPVLFVDALFVKVRQNGKVASMPAYQACAYTEGGKLEIIGIWMPPEGQTSESAAFWHQALIELENRGVEDVLFAGSDGLSGLEEAIAHVWPQAIYTPCVVHLVRNSTRLVSYKDRKELCQGLREIYQAPSYAAAEKALKALDERWNEKYPAVVSRWRENLPRLENLWSLRKPLRKLIYTTNAIENVHNQQRRGLKNRRSFPNRESALRLITLLGRKISDRNVAKSKPRGDWTEIVRELRFHFADRLPEQWGLRDH